MDAKQTILTRQLPKTGALILDPPVDYDDNYYQAGWWKGEKEAPYKTRFMTTGVHTGKLTTDRATGLMWAAAGDGEGCNEGNKISWADALVYAEALNWKGFEDWRVPNIFELMSIVNFGRYNPCVEVDFFPATESGNYWSSTPDISSGVRAWYVKFDIGRNFVETKTNTDYLRLVRGGV